MHCPKCQKGALRVCTTIAELNAEPTGKGLVVCDDCLTCFDVAVQCDARSGHDCRLSENAAIKKTIFHRLLSIDECKTFIVLLPTVEEFVARTAAHSPGTNFGEE